MSDDALAQPVMVTRNGRDRLVVISTEQFKQILSLAVLGAGDSEQAQKLSVLLQTVV